MSLLTQEELSVLEQNPSTAPIAKKLKEEIWIPKGRFDEVLTKQKELSEKLTVAEADRLASTSRVQEAEIQLKSEKAVADQYRQYVKDKKAQLKERFGDLWIPEYEAETFSLSSLEKVAERVLSGNPPGTVIVPPGKQAGAKRLSDMSPLEREAAIAKAKLG